MTEIESPFYSHTAWKETDRIKEEKKSTRGGFQTCSVQSSEDEAK